MSITYNDKNIRRVFHGGTPIKEVWQGNNLVYANWKQALNVTPGSIDSDGALSILNGNLYYDSEYFVLVSEGGWTKLSGNYGIRNGKLYLLTYGISGGHHYGFTATEITSASALWTDVSSNWGIYNGQLYHLSGVTRTLCSYISSVDHVFGGVDNALNDLAYVIKSDWTQIYFVDSVTSVNNARPTPFPGKILGISSGPRLFNTSAPYDYFDSTYLICGASASASVNQLWRLIRDDYELIDQLGRWTKVVSPPFASLNSSYGIRDGYLYTIGDGIVRRTDMHGWTDIVIPDTGDGLYNKLNGICNGRLYMLNNAGITEIGNGSGWQKLIGNSIGIRNWNKVYWIIGTPVLVGNLN